MCCCCMLYYLGKKNSSRAIEQCTPPHGFDLKFEVLRSRFFQPINISCTFFLTNSKKLSLINNNTFLFALFVSEGEKKRRRRKTNTPFDIMSNTQSVNGSENSSEFEFIETPKAPTPTQEVESCGVRTTAVSFLSFFLIFLSPTFYLYLYSRGSSSTQLQSSNYYVLVPIYKKCPPSS